MTENAVVAAADYPQCPKCKPGRLLPLSDYGPDGASVRWKAWACTHAECGYTIRVDKGAVSYEYADRPVGKRA